jgi:hypothetical protein
MQCIIKDYTITLRIQELSLVESHDLLEGWTHGITSHKALVCAANHNTARDLR